ncbi:12115_t:CDS:2 [Entrophospora sp. SA101]|nr:12115_t:CDS:2 [Entrophospora sp. SA101]
MSCKTNYSVKDAHEIATKQDDLCLSDQYASCNIPQDGAVLKGMNEVSNFSILSKYVNCHIPLRWRCTEGHEWDAQLSNIKNCTWYPMACSQMSKRIAYSKNGECLLYHQLPYYTMMALP